MTKKRRYQLLIIATLVITVYIAGAEVFDRWRETFRLHDDLAKKEQSLLGPAELSARKVLLQERKRSLTEKVAARSKVFEQTQAGLVKFLNAQARANGFCFESIAPKDLREAGQLKEISLTLDFQATYHKVGAFVNALETGPFPLGIDRADLIAREPGSSSLQVRLEGRVALPKGTQK
jgi:Tfp pilus assembly protein PilO